MPRHKAREGHGKSCPDFFIFPYQEVPVFAQLRRVAAGFLGLLLKWHLKGSSQWEGYAAPAFRQEGFVSRKARTAYPEVRI